MQSLRLKSLISALSLGLFALSASAAPVNFEDVTPTLVSGSSVSSQGYKLTSSGNGFSGVDNASGFSAMGNAPANANSQFLFALNNDRITLSREDGQKFSLFGFDAAFIPPYGGIGANIDAGELWLLGDTGNGMVADAFWFGLSDQDGSWNMSAYQTQNLLNTAVSSITFLACVYDDTGCNFSSDQFVLPQFALDNLNVPEPGTLVLAALALGAVGVTRRRRNA